MTPPLVWALRRARSQTLALAHGINGNALVSRLEQTGLHRASAIDLMSIGELSATLPDTFLSRSQPTLEHHVQGLVFHEGYHAGQLSSWRRSQGLPPVSWRLAEPETEPV